MNNIMNVQASNPWTFFYSHEGVLEEGEVRHTKQGGKNHS